MLLVTKYCVTTLMYTITNNEAPKVRGVTTTYLLQYNRMKQATLRAARNYLLM